jgi:hypothetical protein
MTGPRVPPWSQGTVVCALAAALAALLGACDSRPQLPIPQVTQIAREVEGFAFESGESHAMGPDYITWNPYRFFTFEGDTWEVQGHGAVTIRRGTKPARYLVQEQVRPTGTFRHNAHLRVVDQATGVVMAEREVIDGNSWNGKAWEDGGWPGDDARKWLATVLMPPESLLPEYLRSNDYSAPARAQMAPQQMDLPKDEGELRLLSVGEHGCGKGGVLMPYPRRDATGLENERAFQPYRNKRTVQGTGWRYVPNLPLQHVACVGDAFVALSFIYATSPTLDLIDRDGHVTFRTELSGGPPSAEGVVGMDHVHVEDGVLHADLAYSLLLNGATPQQKLVPGPTYRISVALDPRAPDSFCQVRGWGKRPSSGWCRLTPSPATALQ